MKKTLLFSLLIILLSSVSWGQDVSLVDTAFLFEKPEETTPTAFLPAGSIVQLKTSNGSWIQIEGYGLKGWTKTPVLTIPKEWKITQDQPLLLSPKIMLDPTPVALWIYKNSLWWYNLDTRKVIKKEPVDHFSAIYGFYRDRWLLVEKTYTDGEGEKPLTMREVWLYDTKTKKQAKIGIFDNKQLFFDDFVVSPDSRYALIRLIGSRRSYTYLWDLNTLQWVGWVTNISQARWVGNTQILFRSGNDLYLSEVTSWLQTKGSSEASKLSLPAGIQRFTSYRLENTTIYLLVEKKVYKRDINETNWSLTDLRSLEWNTEQSLNVYVDSTGGHLYDVRQKKLVKGFSGENPEKEFIAFTLDGLIVQQSFAKIPTLFLFSDDIQEIYRYKAVDKIHAMDGNGTLIEVVNEGGVLLLIVERPQKGYYFIFPERL